MGISTAIDVSAVARVLGIKTNFKDLRGGATVFLPQRVALIGQGSTASVYATTKKIVFSALEVAQTYGFGSPVHLAARQLLPDNGDGIGTIPLTIYPLDDDGAGVVSDGDITPTVAPTEAASYIVRVNEIDSEAFVIPETGATVASVVTQITDAINANLNMPIIASDGTTLVTTASKWKGTSANDIVIEIIGSTTSGNSFVITQHTGGLVNPDVDDALNQIGNVWESMLLNCMDIADTATLNKYQTFGDGRWGALVRKPLITFTGSNLATVALATAVTDARKTDKVNSQLVAPGSNNLPFVIAARELARIVKLANNNPAHDYGSQDAAGLVPGADGDQWNYVERDAAVKAGSSTIEVKDGVINVSDVVTMYHPDGDPLPAYRFVVDIVKLQNIIFNLDLEFASDKWDGAPLIADDDATINPDAKKPKTAVAAAAAIVTNLGLNAILADAKSTIPDIVAEIDGTNPKRLNMVVPVKLSGNTNIKSIDLDFGFNFGTSTLLA